MAGPPFKFERADEAESERYAPRSAPGYLALSIGRIALLVWRTGTSVDGVRAIERVFSSLKQESASEPFGFLTVGAPGMDLRVGSGVRTELARVLKVHGPHIRAAAIAYEGTGFKATIARSIVTAISIASHNEFPCRVFASVDPAMQWLADQVGSVTEEVIAAVRKSALRS